MVLGQTAGAFFEATRVYGQYLGLLVSGSVWTPIPTDLFIKTSDNPLGKTEFAPGLGAFKYIFLLYLNGLRRNLQESMVCL
jgi:hypothetical protein